MAATDTANFPLALPPERSREVFYCNGLTIVENGQLWASRDVTDSVPGWYAWLLDAANVPLTDVLGPYNTQREAEIALDDLEEDIAPAP